MYIFNSVNSKWLPVVSVVYLLYMILLYLSEPVTLSHVLPSALLILPVMLAAVYIASTESGFSFSDFFRRKANTVTLIRSFLASAGILIVLFSAGNKYILFSAILMITTAFAFDALDGYIARRENNINNEWGSWYDAETDAVVLLSSCSALIYFPEVSKVILFPAAARYIFALIFLIFPLPLKSPLWYKIFSKSSAAVFQLLVCVLWWSLLFHPDNSFYSAFLFSFINNQIIIAVSVLIYLSFLIEGYFRIKYLVSLIPSGQRSGLLKSYSVYYLIPGRRKKLASFYSQFISDGELAFDAGSHLGNRTRAFNDLGAEVVAFEPNPACRGILDTWFSSVSNIHLEYSSLGPENGKAELILSTSNPSMSSVNKSWIDSLGRDPLFDRVRWDIKKEVKMMSLDYAVRKYGKPVYIKIDTEGFESSVLEGLSSSVKYISFEFLPGRADLAEDCISRISSLGNYVFNFSEGETLKLYFSDWKNEEYIISFIRDYPLGTSSGDIYAGII